jgi:hypothetical protein
MVVPGIDSQNDLLSKKGGGATLLSRMSLSSPDRAGSSCTSVAGSCGLLCGPWFLKRPQLGWRPRRPWLASPTNWFFRDFSGRVAAA